MSAPRGDSLAAIRDRAILALMGCHGLRVAEIAGLNVDSVEFELNQVKVIGKGDKIRSVVLVESTALALADWLKVRQASDGESALFVALDNAHRGGRMSDRAIRYLVDGYSDSVGLKAEGVSCHSLRHSTATWARFGGASIDAICQMLGHSSTDTTRIYAQIVDKVKENPAKYLESLLAA